MSSTRTLVTLLRPWIRRFTIIISAWWFRTSSKFTWEEVKTSTGKLGKWSTPKRVRIRPKYSVPSLSFTKTPLRKQSRKETKLKNKPWLSKGILISIQQKNLLYKRALKLNDSNTWAQYKVYRNKLTHIKEYAKRLYIKNLVNDNKHDTSSLWKIINKIIHLKNVKKNNIPNKMYASKSESAQGP